MANWLYYLLEANIYLGVFYLAYRLFLANETYYQLTRAYLLFACVVSFILPVLQVGKLKPQEIVLAPATVTYAIPIQTGLHKAEPKAEHEAPVKQIQPVVATTPAKLMSAAAKHHLSLQDYVLYAYIAGAVVLLLMLFIKLSSLFNMARKAQRIRQDDHQLVYLPDTSVAFSFFNYLFIGTHANGISTIIRHELVHIRQRHSADILFLEILKIINWFNPFIYLLQTGLKTVHEYIADEQTAAYETDALTYSSFLVSNAYGAGGSSITHSFFNNNLLKKRVIMLNQERSGKLAGLKYLVTVPVCGALLCASTLAFSKTYGWVDLDPSAPIKATVSKVINAAPKIAIVHTAANSHQNQFGGMVSDIKLTNVDIPVSPAEQHYPLVILNGEKLPLSTEQQARLLAGTDAITFTSVSTVIYPANNAHAIAKWGKAAQYGVYILNGSAFFKATVIETPQVTVIPTEDTEEELPLPTTNEGGYYKLSHYLKKSLHYTPAADDKGGMVVVGFKLDNDLKIVDPKVVLSANDKLDQMALNVFKNYKGTVNDDAGKYLTMSVYFFTDDYSVFKTSTGSIGETSGSVVVTRHPFRFNITAKGYEFDEIVTGRKATGLDNRIRNQVLIYEKDGSSKWYDYATATPADLKLLQDKYGYVFPSNSYLAMEFVPPFRDQKYLINGLGVNSYLDDAYTGEFYDHVYNDLVYPAQEKADRKTGVVLLKFNLDDNGVMKDVDIAKSAGANFDDAALTAVKSFTGTINDKAGPHTMAIVFCSALGKKQPTVGDSFKKDNYVGSLARAEKISPFRFAKK